RARGPARTALRTRGWTRRRAARPCAAPAAGEAGAGAPPASAPPPSARRLLRCRLEHVREDGRERLERPPDAPARAIVLGELVRDRPELHGRDPRECARSDRK